MCMARGVPTTLTSSLRLVPVLIGAEDVVPHLQLEVLARAPTNAILSQYHPTRHKSRREKRTQHARLSEGITYQNPHSLCHCTRK
ncbi:hypothetical protein EV401DRAFT_1902841 [Pisolithus croceorrhizus]|nr:hypothetical protein EV401DRAFT_1902841 [Pisolithus croceorrhizus]